MGDPISGGSGRHVGHLRHLCTGIGPVGTLSWVDLGAMRAICDTCVVELNLWGPYLGWIWAPCGPFAAPVQWNWACGDPILGGSGRRVGHVRHVCSGIGPVGTLSWVDLGVMWTICDTCVVELGLWGPYLGWIWAYVGNLRG